MDRMQKLLAVQIDILIDFLVLDLIDMLQRVAVLRGGGPSTARPEHFHIPYVIGCGEPLFHIGLLHGPIKRLFHQKRFFGHQSAPPCNGAHILRIFQHWSYRPRWACPRRGDTGGDCDGGPWVHDGPLPPTTLPIGLGLFDVEHAPPRVGGVVTYVIHPCYRPSFVPNFSPYGTPDTTRITKWSWVTSLPLPCMSINTNLGDTCFSRLATQ